MSNQGLIKLTRHGRSRGRGWWLPHLWQQLGALRLRHPRGGLAHSGGVPAGGLDPTLPPVKSRQVFPGLELEAGWGGSSSLEDTRSGTQRKKKGFCPWLHIWPGGGLLQPPEGTETVIRVPQMTCKLCVQRHLQSFATVLPGGPAKGHDQPIL